MSLDPRLKSALDDVRRANLALDGIARLHARLNLAAADLSYARVELSVAAGKLAQIVDEASAQELPPAERGCPFDEDLGTREARR